MDENEKDFGGLRQDDSGGGGIFLLLVLLLVLVLGFLGNFEDEDEGRGRERGTRTRTMDEKEAGIYPIILRKPQFRRGMT